MKILFLMHSFLKENNAHGVGVLTYDLINQIPEHQFVVLDRDFKEDSNLFRDDYRSIERWTISSPYPEFNLMRDHRYQDDETIALLESFLASQHFDIVHIHHLISWPINTIEVLRRYCKSIVLSVHDTWYVCPDLNYYNKLANSQCSKILRSSTVNNCQMCLKSSSNFRFSFDKSITWYTDQILSKRGDYLDLLRQANAVVFPTKKYLQLYKQEGLQATETNIIPYFIDISEKPSTSDGNTVGYIGNIGFGKGVDTLLRSMEQLPEISFKIYGSLFDPTLNIKNYHGSYQYEQLPEILANLDVVVVPSIYPESFNICSYAAVKSGKALVVSDIAVHEEFLKPGENCFVFKAGDHESLTQAIRAAINNNRDIRKFVPTPGIYGDSYRHLYKKVTRPANGKLPCTLVSLRDVVSSQNANQFESVISIRGCSAPQRGYLNNATCQSVSVALEYCLDFKQDVVVARADLDICVIRKAYFLHPDQNIYIHRDGETSASDFDFSIIRKSSETFEKDLEQALATLS